MGGGREVGSGVGAIRLLIYRGVGGGREGGKRLRSESLGCCNVVDGVWDAFEVG